MIEIVSSGTDCTLSVLALFERLPFKNRLRILVTLVLFLFVIILSYLHFLLNTCLRYLIKWKKCIYIYVTENCQPISEQRSSKLSLL